MVDFYPKKKNKRDKEGRREGEKKPKSPHSDYNHMMGCSMSVCCYLTYSTFTNSFSSSDRDEHILLVRGFSRVFVFIKAAVLR